MSAPNAGFSKQLLNVATSSRNDLGLLLTFRNVNRSLELCALYGVGVTDDIYDKLHNLCAEFICDVGHFSWFCCSCYLLLQSCFVGPTVVGQANCFGMKFHGSFLPPIG